MNNLFSHSPKELTTDGFITWLILEISHDQKLVGSFFARLGLCESQKQLVTNVRVSRQEKNTDVIVRYEIDSQPRQALFENKTYTTVHSNQFSKYKKEFPNFDYYKYLKLARVNYFERLQAKEHGYEILTSHDLFEALSHIEFKSEIVNQYKCFLKNNYLDPIKEIENTLVSKNNYDLFSDRQAQQYLIDSLYEKVDGLNDAIYFKSKSNVGGSPWTQLDICRREKSYDDINEYLFWRIDKKSGEYYLRLNQYADIDSKHKGIKSSNLTVLRERIEPLFVKYGLVPSKPSNRGMKESEVCIIFFRDNLVKKVSDVLADLTIEIVSCYQIIEFS